MIEGDVVDRYTSKNNFKKLNPATMPHYVKAKIQQDRRDLGLSEVTDWEEFAKDSVFIPSRAGALWVGPDDPRCVRFVTRREKHKVNPLQIPRRQPAEDMAEELENHPLRGWFVTPVNFNNPLSIAEGVYKSGGIK